MVGCNSYKIGEMALMFLINTSLKFILRRVSLEKPDFRMKARRTSYIYKASFL